MVIKVYNEAYELDEARNGLGQIDELIESVNAEMQGARAAFIAEHAGGNLSDSDVDQQMEQRDDMKEW